MRISRLRALIDHPRTGFPERDAAQRMLDRILGQSRPALSSDRCYGSRHDRVGRHAGLSRLAEMIRTDIAVARACFSSPGALDELATTDPIGNMPPEVEIDVDTPHDAEIVVTISGVPAAWGWQRDGDIAVVSPALQSLADELAAMMNAYNHRGADISARFHGRIRADGTTLVW